MMSASTPLTPFVLSRQKPQAKSLSPVSRNLFGQSSAAEVTQMLNEVFMSEKQKAQSKLNFDIWNEIPVKQQQQENIAEVDRTPETRRRYAWKLTKPGEAPEFYSRRYKGKKNLMPVDLLNCSPEPTNSRSRSVRRSLNGYLRTPSKEFEKRSLIRPSSESTSQESPPLRTMSPQRIVDSPATFDDCLKLRVNASLLRPLAVHAATEKSLTAKVYTPNKSVSPRLATRSPLSQRENRSGSARSLVFTATPRKSSLLATTEQETESNVTSSVTHGSSISSSAEKSCQPAEKPMSSFTTPKTSVPSAMKQLLLPDMIPVRKLRSPGQKARKRLILSEDSPSSVPSAKTPRLSRGEN